MNRKETEQELWINVAVAVAGSDGCIRTGVPGAYADQALADFREAFPPPVKYAIVDPEHAFITPQDGRL